MEFRHAPVVYVLAAAHCVGETDLPIVAVVDIAHRRGHAALGHDRVGLAKQRLAGQSDTHARGRGLDRGPKSRPARTDDDHVVFKCRIVVHRSTNSPWDTSSYWI